MTASQRARVATPLVALMVISTLALNHFAGRYHRRLNDETISVLGGRWVAGGLPESLWADQLHFFDRGPERLTPWLLGLVDTVAGSTPSEFVVGHFVIALAMASVALPVAALGRGLGLTWLQAALPAALCVAGPWAIFGITFLNTTLGLATASALLVVAWRVAVRPSRRWELAVLAATAATILARVGHAPLVLALGPALIAAQWYGRPEGERAGAWAKAFPLRFARTWPILTAVAALGLLAVVVYGQARLLGGYGSQITGQDLQLERVWLQTRVFLSRAALATGLLPVLLGVPWLLRTVWRPGSREAGVFAVLGIGWLAVVLYVFYTAAVVEDRYLAVMLPVLVLAFARVLFAREAWLLGTAVTAVLLGRAIARVGIYPTDEPFSYFIAPGSQFFKRVVVTRTELALPFGASHALTLVLVAAGVLAVAAAVAVSRLGAGRLRAAATASVALGVVGYTAVAGAYAAQKFTAQVGRPELTFEDLSFVDRVAAGRTVGVIAFPDQAELVTQIERFFDLSYFNRSLRSSVDLDGPTAFACCAPRPLPRVVMRSDPRTGAVTVLEGRQPRLYVQPVGFQPRGLNTRRIATGDPAMTVEQPRTERPQLSFVTIGVLAAGGWGVPDRAIRRRVFPPAAGKGPACWTANLEAAPEVPGAAQRFTITGGARPVRGVINGRTTKALSVPLRREDVSELRIRVTPAGRLDDGRPVTVRAADDHVVPCGER